jgi:superfamily II DNA or RNA helicase
VPRTLPEGLYEHLVTRILDTDLAHVAPLRFDLATIDDVDLAPFLVRHVSAEVDRALREVKTEAKQLEVAHAILACLDQLAPESDSGHNAAIAPPARLLRSVYRTTQPARPATPLSSSTLLTRTRNEPALGHELALEIASADEIDILSAFITMGGVRAVREALEGAVQRGARIRILTTVFTGTTEVGAIDALARLPGASVRISYDVRRTRLHAKAWLFRRHTDLHTAYVGSANLTATALGSGQEWMVKICAADLPHLIAKFEGTFEGLWNDDEFEPYDAASEPGRVRLREALGAEKSSGDSTVIAFFTLRPFPFQEEILDRLAAERSLHGRMRNLLVAATGTGKTVIAAFDYLRACERSGSRPRLLFLAHRREILDQARATFQQVLRDFAFGEKYLDGEVPSRWEHVFASIQTAASGLAERVAADHFRFVVVDECHHAPAESYQRVIRFLAPAILLGLTATPERSDGKSLLPDFDGRIAVELRLWHALERQLLVPFEYYGIADGTDLTALRWSRNGYAAADLAGVYTGHEARVDLVLEQLRRRVADLRLVRAIAFCVSVDHANFMACALTERGVAALAVHGQSSDTERTDAPRRLQAREVTVICTCDLYNEGVDLPFVDTLLLLRPTSSATLFLQQIGRGLRLDSGKTSCLVLDFIGQHRAEFRFDAIYAGLTGIPRAKLVRAVEEGFPYLPAGCLFQLDDEVSAQVVRTLRAAVASAATLAHELRQLSSDRSDVTLAHYLEASGRDVEDVYDAGGWTSLRTKAGLCDEVAEASDLSRRLGWLLHTDEPSRLRLWAAPTDVGPGDNLDRRRLTMLDFQLNHRGMIRQPAETVEWLSRHAPIRKELRELGEVLGERVPFAEEFYPVPEWPLAIHRHYTRREICAGVGSVKPGEKGSIPQGGILKLEAEKRELLLVTLEKSAKSFSPTTRYKDYAISAKRFHWETQAAASVSRPSGRRYLDSPENGWSFYLFVRPDPNSAYAFLGRANFVSAAGDRPIGITWELEQPMPGALFDRFASLAQG